MICAWLPDWVTPEFLRCSLRIETCSTFTHNETQQGTLEKLVVTELPNDAIRVLVSLCHSPQSGYGHKAVFRGVIEQVNLIRSIDLAGRVRVARITDSKAGECSIPVKGAIEIESSSLPLPSILHDHFPDNKIH